MVFVLLVVGDIGPSVLLRNL